MIIHAFYAKKNDNKDPFINKNHPPNQGIGYYSDILRYIPTLGLLWSHVGNKFVPAWELFLFRFVMSLFHFLKSRIFENLLIFGQDLTLKISKYLIINHLPTILVLQHLT